MSLAERFLKYSLERKRKICVVLMQDGQMRRTNLLVTALEDGGFRARLSGHKGETVIALCDVLTASYARGDQGELE